MASGATPADGPAGLLPAAQNGDRRAVAKLISIVEASANRGRDDNSKTLDAVYQAAGKARVIGVTGPPGAGKSTLVTALVKEFRKQGTTVGVIAIDPSSPFSGGAILGDRVRMGDLGADDGVFIRSLATQGAMGGLARPALDAVDVLDAVGYEIVIIETVGVGQDEVDVAAAAHTVLVASPPGLGDGVQAIKAGLLEIADIHVVTKADKPEAKTTASDIENGTGLRTRDGDAWAPPVVLTSANNGTGIAELAAEISNHFNYLEQSGKLDERRRHAARARLLAAAHDQLDLALSGVKADADDAVDAIANRSETPRNAARDLVRKAFGRAGD